jgi:hypothetical protein
MNQDEFVRAVKTVVRDAAAAGVIRSLQRPPGRKPDLRVTQLSERFLKLSASDRDFIMEVAALAADQAAYNFLLALDGLVGLAPPAEQGRFKLLYQTPAASVELNDPAATELSALFKTS